jgi:hypothetical protein
MPKKKTVKKAASPKQPPAKAQATTPSTVAPKLRRLRLPAPKLFGLRRVKHPIRLPNVWQLTQKTLVLLWSYRKLFLLLALIYGLLNIVFVRGLSGGTDVAGLKDQFNQALQGNTSQLVVGFSVFTALLASSGNNTSATAGAYQLFIGLIVSLAAIWALRQAAAGEHPRLRDTLYKGMYPLIPFVLVLAVVLLQCVPFLLGAGLYSLLITGGIAVQPIEMIVAGAIFLVLAFATIYMLCSSLFAVYIVTLPDMTPMKALRNARQLVRYRRLSVFRKLLFLVVALLLAAAIIMVPIIVVIAPLAQWVFFGLSMCGLIVLHAYMYTLYRELLNEAE